MSRDKMVEKLSDKLSHFVEIYNNAFLVVEFKNDCILYFNKTASNVFGISADTKNLEHLFQSAPFTLKTLVEEGLMNRDLVVYNNIKVIGVQGQEILCDIQMGYFDEGKTEVFIEITPKPDMRLENAKKQIEESARSIAIVNDDETLSTYHGNKHFMKLLRENGAKNSEEFSLSFILPQEGKEKLVEEIKSQLAEKGAFTTNVELSDGKGGTEWYSLGLHKRQSDDMDEKIFAHLNNIKNIKQMEEDLDDITQYFNILQALCRGLLYRFDIEHRTLYRSEETAKKYDVPVVTRDFPRNGWLEKMVHQEDAQGFSDFIDLVVAGQEGAHTARLRTPEGSMEYHKFTFKPIRRGDGTIKEMIGCAMNVHNLKETQKELENVNQYFSILQTMTKGMLYRFDIQNKVLYRDEGTAQFYGVPAVAENYPDASQLQGVFHTADVAGYLKFIRHVLNGVEGTHNARLYSPTGKYEYHRITFKALRNKDGSVKEMIGNAINVQDLKDTESQLSTVNQYFDILQSFSKDLLYRLDLNTRTLYRNEHCSAFYGIPPVVENYPNFESLEGVFHPDDIENYVKYVNDVLGGEEGTHTARLISPTGNFEYHKFTFKKLERMDGTITEMIGHAVNVHSLMELETKAMYDMLTSCMNKISFQEQVTHILNDSTIQDRHALFFVDLDDFKGINDNLGHSFGDFLLQTVGTRLKNLVRDNDIVGRVGGDEFVLFLENCGDDLHLEKRGIQILEALREEYLQNSTSATIKGSVGVSVYPTHGTKYEELYEKADKALYHSKYLGKNVTTIYYKGLGE